MNQPRLRSVLKNMGNYGLGMVANKLGNAVAQCRAYDLRVIVRLECHIGPDSLFGNLSMTDMKQLTKPAVSNVAATPPGMVLQSGAGGRPFHDKNNATIK